MTGKADPAPFKNLKVLDFTWAGAGSFCVNYFAWYGATVVKLENKKRPDITRTAPPYKDGIPGLERSLYFAWTHPAKKFDITLNLNHAKGVDIAKKLVQWSDVIVESFVAGTLEKWGLGYEDIKKINPQVIMLRTCTHGQTGRLAKQPALGFTLATLSGFNNLTGWPDRESNEAHGAYTDFITPLFGALALTAALDYKRRTGKGQCIDLSQHETALQFLSPLLLNAAVNNIDPKVMGNDCDRAVPHGVYKCLGDERWCAISIFSDTQWQRFCFLMGNPAWSMDARFGTMEKRLLNREELDRRVQEFTADKTAEELMERLQASGIPAGLVANAEDLTKDKQLKHYQFFRRLDHPEMGECAFYQTPPFRLPRAAAEMALPPMLGGDTHYICTDFLGMTDEEVNESAKVGAFD